MFNIHTVVGQPRQLSEKKIEIRVTVVLANVLWEGRRIILPTFIIKIRDENVE